MMCAFQAKYQELMNHKNDKLYSPDIALCDGTGHDVCISGQVPGADEPQKW